MINVEAEATSKTTCAATIRARPLSIRQSNGASWANNHRKIPMTKKFDPAPDDKHSADPKKR
jgi:hypothetical protein